MATSPEPERVTLTNADELAELIDQPASNARYNITVNFAMDQKNLSKLAKSQVGSHTIELTIHPDYDDCGPPIIDFSEVHFPLLEDLETNCQAIRAVHFTKENTPRLKRLSIEQPCARDLMYFDTDLPELETMSFQFVTIMNTTKFGKSLSRSPKLKRFVCYKLWGLGTTKSRTHTLVLPSCETLNLYRSDDVNYLKIWAPRLEELNFQACYSITEVNLLDRKPNGYTGPEYAFNGTPSKYKVNFLNTSRPAGNITTHQRCRAVFPDPEVDLEDDFAAINMANPEVWWSM